MSVISVGKSTSPKILEFATNDSTQGVGGMKAENPPMV